MAQLKIYYLIQIGWHEVSDFIVWGGAVPHAALRIEEEFLHHVFGMGIGKFGDFPGLRIEAANHIHLVGGIPDVVLTVDSQSVGGCPRARQIGPG